MRQIAFVFEVVLLVILADVSAIGMQAVDPAPPKTEPSHRLVLVREIEDFKLQLGDYQSILNQHREAIRLPSEVEIDLAKQVNDLETKLLAKEIFTTSLEEIRTALTVRRVDLMIDIAGLSAKKEAYLKLTDERRADERGAREIDRQLEEKKFELAELNFQKTKALVDKGAGSSTELATSELEMLMARQRYAAKEFELKKANSPDDRFHQLAWDLIDKQAQLEMVNQLLSHSVEAKSTLDEMKQKQERLNQLKSAREFGQLKTLKEAEAHCAEIQKFLLMAIKEFEREEENDED